MSDSERDPADPEPEERRAQRELELNLDCLLRDNPTGIIDNPIRHIEDHLLRKYLKPLHRKCKGVVNMDELYRAAKLAKIEHSLDLGRRTDILELSERKALRIQRSRAFWKEPKDLQMTIAVCCLASAVQGWDQVANGNFGWPFDPHTGTSSTLVFAVVQAVPWFSAAILGSWLSDPLSERIGRRRALFVAGCCSFTGSLAGFWVQSWRALIGTRVVLGLGIGGKASIVPVILSEMLPPSKRGRVLVSWQTFTATGLFCGSVVCYILRGHWRSQYASGSIPALILLATTFGSCESPRWLIIMGLYDKAYTTLVRLRGERVLAAKELVSIHYQIQAERRVFLKRHIDPERSGLEYFDSDLQRSSYRERLFNMFFFPRIRRAAIAATIVMASQPLSGINILAFLGAQFYTAFGPVHPVNLNDPNVREAAEASSSRFAIGFGLANMIFSIVAYFLVENSDPSKDQDFPTPNDESATSAQRDIDESTTPSNRQQSANMSLHSSFDLETYNSKQRFRGRRFLLLTSLAAGVITLLLTSTMFNLEQDIKRTRLIVFFTIVFTAFYSPGAGAIPFLYCAEIFPNEGRELGMSWSTFCNFIGAGLLAFAVPFGFIRHPGKLIGVFSACNAVAFVMVFFFVPGTNHTATLEDMNYVFSRKLRSHARDHGRLLLDFARRLKSIFPEYKNRRIRDRLRRNGSNVQNSTASEAEQPVKLAEIPKREGYGKNGMKEQIEKAGVPRRVKSLPSILP